MKTRNPIEVQHLGITIKITREHDRRFIIPDYSSGKRVRHARTDEASAREKAKEVCEILAKGKQEERDLLLDNGLRLEVTRAIQALKPTGKHLLPAAYLFAQATAILGNPDEIIRACEYWKLNRPDGPIRPRKVEEAVNQYLAAQTHLFEYSTIQY